MGAMHFGNSKNNPREGERTGEDIELLVRELMGEADTFLRVHSELSRSVPAEDYDWELNAVTAATAHLRVIMRSFALKYDDTAESVRLAEVIAAIEESKLPRPIKITRPKVLPVVHVNRRRIETLFTLLIGDAIKNKAKRIALSIPRKGHFKLSDDRPKSAHLRGGDHFALTSIGQNGRAQANVDLYLAKEIVGFYGGGIRISFTARSVEFDFTLPTEG
jgi:hypothetical protein